VSGASTLTIADVGEFPLIARLKRRFEQPGSGIVRGIGDDTAVLRPRPGRLLLATTDALVEGVHFRRETTTPALIGRRALAVNLSDVAAMGGEPRWVLVSLSMPRETPLSFAEELADGMAKAAEEHGAIIVGGNLATALAGITVDVTLLGEVEPGRAVYRTGARPGDRVLVTGTLGDAAAGLEVMFGTLDVPAEIGSALVARQRAPTPRVVAGRAIATTGGATAMIDLSDGLASDLGHILEESRAGATIEASRLPISSSVRVAARLAGRDALDWATRGGEDYELLFTAPPAAVGRLADAVVAVGVAVTEIGEITSERDGVLVLPDATRVRLGGTLWRHFAANER
jgi:thiamine-monophosphate kinase